MVTRHNPADYLLSAVSAEGAGPTALDCRATMNHAYLFYQAAGHSGIFTLQGSHDNTAWMNIATYTATATQSGTAQIAGFYPYVRATVNELYSAAGGTGTLYVHYSPGLV